MSEQSETERNEAEYALQILRELEKTIRNNKEPNIVTITYQSQTYDAINIAITALRAQSEADRKLEKAIAECKKEIKSLGKIIDINVKEGCIPYFACGGKRAYESILEILEDKTE